MSLSRTVTFLSPYVAMVSATLATWLFTHFPGIHILGSQSSVARILSEGGVWIITALITYAIHHKWLDGLSKWERRLADRG